MLSILGTGMNEDVKLRNRKRDVNPFIRAGLIGLAVAAIGVFLWFALQDGEDSPAVKRGAPADGAPREGVAPAGPETADPSILTRSASKTGDPLGIASLNASETAERMIGVADEYAKLEEALYRQVPHLPDIASWLHHRGHEQFYFPNKELIDKVNADFAYKRKTLPQQRDVVKFYRPENLLELLDDPEFKTWTEEVYEVAGLREAFPSWLEDWDREAGYSGTKLPPTEVNTLAEFRSALEERVPFYGNAREEAESRSELPPWMLDYLEIYAIHNEKTQIAQYYHDSFFGGRLEEIETEYRKLTSRLRELQVAGAANNLSDEAKAALREVPSKRLKAVGGFKFYTSIEPTSEPNPEPQPNP